MGPPKYTLSRTCARCSRSGRSCETEIRIGLLMMMPTGAGPRLFITSTTESAKWESGSSSRALRRIAVRGFASVADVGHDEPDRSRRAPSAPATQRCRQKPLLTDDTRLRVTTLRRTSFGGYYPVDATGARRKFNT